MRRALKALGSLGLVSLVCTWLCLGGGLAEARGKQALPRGDGSSVFDGLPLSFEANRGQVSEEVKFLARGQGFTAFLTDSGLVLTLRGNGAGANERLVLRMGWAGGAPVLVPRGLDKLRGRVNYFRGNDPALWHQGIPTYAKVLYKNVYPGIDVVFHGDRRNQFEFDFIVWPGADPASICLSLDASPGGNERLGESTIKREGLKREGQEPLLRIDEDGALVLTTGAGGLRFCRPAIYQDKDGARHDVAGRYLLTGEGQVRFEVAAYDPGRPLVIDPVVVVESKRASGEGADGWLDKGQKLNRPGGDVGQAIAVDADGSVYVTGVTFAENFPTSPEAFQPAIGDPGGVLGDAFVVKLDESGTTLLYSTLLGGSGRDGGTGIAIDAAGDAYVTGYTSSRDFPGTAEGRYGGGASDAFVARIRETELEGEGEGELEPVFRLELVYSIYVGGRGADTGNGIDVDGPHNAYITGDTSSMDFPTTEGALRPRSSLISLPDAFVVKINDDSEVEYATYLGGLGADSGRGIAVDSGGYAYVTGTTFSEDFAAESIGPTQKARDFSDVFVAKINVSGTALDYAVYLGGAKDDEATGIALDTRENAYVTGWTESEDFPVTDNALQPSLGGGRDAFVAEIDTPGSSLVYATYLGGKKLDEGRAIAVDVNGSAVVAGRTFSDDIGATEGAVQTEPGGNSDIFVARIEKSGGRLAYLTYLGGFGVEEGLGIAVDGSGYAYVTGLTYSSWDFPVTQGVLQGVPSTPPDAFVAKISAGGARLDYSTFLGGSTTYQGPSIGCASGPMDRSPTKNRVNGASGGLVLLTMVAAFLFWTGGKL